MNLIKWIKENNKEEIFKNKIEKFIFQNQRCNLIINLQLISIGLLKSTLFDLLDCYNINVETETIFLDYENYLTFKIDGDIFSCTQMYDSITEYSKIENVLNDIVYNFLSFEKIDNVTFEKVEKIVNDLENKNTDLYEELEEVKEQLEAVEEEKKDILWDLEEAADLISKWI